MVDIYGLWKDYIGFCAKYQLQVSTVDDFNQKIKQIQNELFSMLHPHYRKNEFVRSLLEPFLRRIYDISDQNGQLLNPQRVGVEEQTTEVFCRIIGFSVTDGNGNILFPIVKVMESAIGDLQNIPQRQPDLTKNRCYYLSYDNVTQLYPQQSINYMMFYLVYPDEANLAFTYQLVNGEYVQVFDQSSTVNLNWNKNAENLILYMVLEKYGITTRDVTLQEFGKAGIALLFVQGQPQPNEA